MLSLETLFRMAYSLNIIILIPVCLSLFFGINQHGFIAAFDYKIQDSPGLRFLILSLWFGILICSICGLFFPFQFWSILLLQIIYKAFYLVSFIVPLYLHSGLNAIPIGVTISFIFIMITYPIILFKFWSM